MTDQPQQFSGSLVEWTFLLPSGGFKILAQAERPALQAATCKVKEDKLVGDADTITWRPGIRARCFIGSVG